MSGAEKPSLAVAKIGGAVLCEAYKDLRDFEAGMPDELGPYTAARIAEKVFLAMAEAQCREQGQSPQPEAHQTE